VVAELAKGLAVPRKRVTIINDDAVYMELMKDLLEEEGYRATIWDRKDNRARMRGGRSSNRCASIR
jgi:hypothetical protein